MTRVSKVVLPAWVSTDQIIADRCVVFPTQDDAIFGLLSSSFHSWWTFRWSTTQGEIGNISYSQTDVYETLPKPSIVKPSSPDHRLVDAAQRLEAVRADFMSHSQLGLTKTYNRVHDPDDQDPQIDELRILHIELDHAVRDAYGWSDLELDHHHWETPQGMRFTVSLDAKDELLDRLLELNQHRYAEEVAAGLHKKKSKKSMTRRASNATSEGQGELL